MIDIATLPAPRLRAVLIAAVLTSTATGPCAAGKTYVFDDTLIVDARDGSTKNAAFIFDDGDRALEFVAADHGSPASIVLVERAFVDGGFAPEAVVVEREPSRDARCSQAEMAMFHSRGPDAKPEPCVAMQLADKAGATVVHGEMEFRDSFAALRRVGVSVEDVETHWILRSMVGYDLRSANDPEWKTKSFDQIFALLAPDFERQHGVASAFHDGEELQRHYEAMTGRLRGFLVTRDVSGDEYFRTVPFAKEVWTPGDSGIGRVARASVRVRDAFLGRQIAAILAKRRRVLVVYGGGHYDELHKALSHMMGVAPRPVP